MGIPESNPIVPRAGHEPNEASTPEDVATLYSWANLHGAKYRDFSASRAQAREEARLRVEAIQAEERRRQQEEDERKAQEEAQNAARLAAEAAEAARQAEAERLAEISRQAEAERQAVLAAQEAQRQAALQRSWQPTLAEGNQGSHGLDIGAPLVAAQDSQLSPAAHETVSGSVLEPAVPFRSATFAEFYSSQESLRLAKSSGAREIGSMQMPQDRPWDEQPPIRSNAFSRSEPGAVNQPFAGSSISPEVSSPHYNDRPVQDPFHIGASGAAPFVAQQPVPFAAHGNFAMPAANQPPFVTPVQVEERRPAQRQHAAERSPWHLEERRSEARDSRESNDLIAGPAWLAPQPVPSAQPVPSYQPFQTPANAVPQHRSPVYPVPSIYPPPSAEQAVSRMETPRGTVQARSQVPMYSQPVVPYVPAFSSAPSSAAQYAAGDSPQGQSDPRPSSESPASGPIDDTLAGSRDRIASRWFALKGVFDPHLAPVDQVPSQPPAHVPVLAVFSLAGGVGKTSLVASLGRALSSRGERVLLVDTAAFGLLPFYFGARDQRPGLLRTFNPPGVSTDAPIQLVTIDPESQPVHGTQNQGMQSQDPQSQGMQAGERGGMVSSHGANQTTPADWLAEEVVQYTRSANRVLIDLPTASGATTRRILRLSPVVLVPVLADMNSVVSVSAIESFFQYSVDARNSTGRPILPFYVLNEFDYTLPLHLDVREILRERIGERLLPFALRRSPAVSEALAEGMTVIDYAPASVIAEDYASLAGWVRSLSAPATQSYRGVRWSER